MNVLYMVSGEIAPDVEAAWDAWNTEHHLPDVLREPGFLRARKYRLEGDTADGWKRWLIVYEMESREALEAYLNGEAVIRLRNDQTVRFGGRTRLSRSIGIPSATLERA